VPEVVGDLTNRVFHSILVARAWPNWKARPPNSPTGLNQPARGMIKP
jgi:hypothetical protein